MELVKFNCKKCGAELDKPSVNFGPFLCKHCGTLNELDMEKYEFKYLKTHGVEDISKTIHSKKLRAHKLLFEEKKYEEAYEVYLELYDLVRNDIEIAEGLMVSYSKDFTSKLYDDEINIVFVNNFDSYCDLYSKLSDDPEKLKEYRKKYVNFYQKYLMFRKVSTTIIGFLGIVLVSLIAFIIYLLSIIN